MRKSLKVLRNAIEGLANYKSMKEPRETKDMFYNVSLATADVIIKELDLMMKCALVNEYKLPKDTVKYDESLPRFVKRNKLTMTPRFGKIEYEVQGRKPNPIYIFERARTYLTYPWHFLQTFDIYKNEELFSEIYDKQDKNLYVAQDEPVPLMRPNWVFLLTLKEE